MRGRPFASGESIDRAREAVESSQECFATARRPLATRLLIGSTPIIGERPGRDSGGGPLASPAHCSRPAQAFLRGGPGHPVGGLECHRPGFDLVFAVEPPFAGRQARQGDGHRHQVEKLSIFLLKIGGGVGVGVGHGAGPRGRVIQRSRTRRLEGFAAIPSGSRRWRASGGFFEVRGYRSRPVVGKCPTLRASSLVARSGQLLTGC